MQVRLISLSLSSIVALTWLAQSRAWANPGEQLAEGIKRCQGRDYKGAIPLLSNLLYPDIQLSRKSQIVEAQIFLGVAHFYVGNHDRASDEFTRALYLDNLVDLDPLIFDDDVIAFFAPLREALLKRIESDRIKLEQARLREKWKDLIFIERRPYFINFVPFGAGQYQNDQNYKGLFFSTTELATCSTSAILWVVQAGRYGFNGKVPEDEVAGVRRMQQWQVGTGVACLVLIGAGIIDALINYKSETRLPADPSLMPDEYREEKETPTGGSVLRPDQERSSVKFRLTAGATGAGVAMSWEF